MSPLLTAEVATSLTTSYIWYDYFCIPQIPGESKLAAIESIPSYISRATYLFVLAPTLHHNDLPSVVSKGTWQQRGWCRVEQSIYSLTRSGHIDDTVAIFIYHSGFVVESVPMQWLYALPHKGNFTSEEDRPIIESMISKVAENRLMKLKQRDASFEWRFMQCILRYVKGGVPAPKSTTLADWLAEYSFGLMTDAGTPDGWQPIHFAAVEGNTAVVSALVEKGVSVNAPTVGNGHEVMAVRALTPLMVAAYYIPCQKNNLVMVSHLLSLRADVHAKTDLSQQAIHFASLGPGAAESLQFLVSQKADVHAQDAGGETALHYSAFTNATSNMARDDAVEILLKAGADPNQIGGPLGWTPWHALVPSGSVDMVRTFVQSKCDPNLQLPQHVARDMLKSEVEKHERENIIADLAVHGEGLSPLMLAAWTGNWEVCEVLLESGADVNLKTNTGRTALDWLEDNGVFMGPTHDLLAKFGNDWTQFPV
mmetsp:Transcript_13839/g.25405  ORF Transcript_13839/g.25405 Transcript_13839/m.25405 type:complete len:481 (+) Transcript_13839:448-1890(+)